MASTYPTAAALEQRNKDRMFNFDQSKWEEQKKIDLLHLNQAERQFNQNYALENLRFMQGKAQTEFENFWHVYTDKDASQEQKNSAATGLADALQRQGTKVTTENIFKLMHPFEGRTELRVPQGKTGAADFAGKAPKNPFTGEDDPGYASRLWDYLKQVGSTYVDDYFFGTQDKKK
jgi:hypothetical protein